MALGVRERKLPQRGLPGVDERRDEEGLRPRIVEAGELGEREMLIVCWQD